MSIILFHGTPGACPTIMCCHGGAFPRPCTLPTLLLAVEVHDGGQVVAVLALVTTGAQALQGRSQECKITPQFTSKEPNTIPAFVCGLQHGLQLSTAVAVYVHVDHALHA